jgi:hypothetical protein
MMPSYVTCWSGTIASASPAVCTMWSTAPACAKKLSRLASAPGPLRLTVYPATRAGSALYCVFTSPSRATAAATFSVDEDEMTTDAPSSTRALATAKPIPDEPPMTTTFLPASLFTTRGVGAMVGSDCDGAPGLFSGTSFIEDRSRAMAPSFAHRSLIFMHRQCGTVSSRTMTVRIMMPADSESESGEPSPARKPAERVSS